MKRLIALLLFAVVLSIGCTKQSSISNPEIVVKKEGILRVECNSCDVNYTINEDKFNVSIDSGSNDIPFYYTDDFSLKTEVMSKEEQNIRVIVIDSFGRLISNELSNRKKDELSKMNFNINIR